MSKYDDQYYEDKSVKSARPKIHPIWRGIGFVFLVLSPFIAYFSSVIVIQENSRNKWFSIPYDLIAKGSDPLIYVKLLISIAILFIIYLVFSFITFVVYRLFAPPRYGPNDVPRVSYRGRKYKR